MTQPPVDGCESGGDGCSTREADREGPAPDGERLREAWQADRPAWTEESWWDVPLRGQVRALMWLPAGPALAEALARVPGSGSCSLAHSEHRDPGMPTPGHAPGWPCACQVVLAAAWQACAGWATAGAAQALVDAAGAHPVQLVVADGAHTLHDPARDELAHALRWTVPSMGRRITAARALAAHPDLVELVACAAITPWAGQLVTEHLADLTQEQAGAVVAAVAARVRQRLATGRRPYTSAEVNQAARAARLKIAPVTDREARIRAFAGRRVVVQQRPDGMATLIAELSDTDAHRIHRRLTAIAAGLATATSGHPNPEQRTRDQLRADILTDLLLGTPDLTSATPTPTQPAPGQAPSPTQPAPGPAPATGATALPAPARTEIQVIVTLETLLGMSCQPGHVPGLGPIPADTARELAADGRWTAWLTDTAGTVTATSTHGYVPSAALARLVRAREPRCRFPGCRQPAMRCDLDHAIPWPRGTTSSTNLGPLCRRHHQLKTHGSWRLEPHTPPPDQLTTHPTGWTWHTPAGFAVHDQPEPPLE